MLIFDRIVNLSQQKHEEIQKLIRATRGNRISFEGFQIMIDLIRPVVVNKKLQSLIDNSVVRQQKGWSPLTLLLYAYLNNGLHGLINYKIQQQNQSPDKAIRETTDFVYNTLKYQTVKYLGAFNIMYKYFISKRQNIKFESVLGIERLLLKLEHDAISEEARVASDYGVPVDIVHYYEEKLDVSKDAIKQGFDRFESEIFERIDKLISKN